MKVSRGKASLTSDLSVDGDIDFLTLYQAKRLASPASGEALRKGNKDIANAEIADAAAIAISKLATPPILNSLLTTQGDIIVRGASIPARLAKITTGQLLKATATGYEGADETPQKVYDALVANFQANAATGTSTNPQNINNNSVGTASQFDAIGEYAIVDFGMIVNIKRWRMYGSVDDNGSGRYKFWYWNLVTRAWVEWASAIPTRTTADWSTMATLAEVITSKFKIECTTVDTNNTRSQCTELEVIY